MASLQSCHAFLTRDAPASSLVSSASPVFVSSPASFAPPSVSCYRRPVRKLAACCLPENRKPVSSRSEPASEIRRGLVAGVIATGAAIALFTNTSLAAIGPGGDGARRTAEKADDLLKAADKLNIEEAPPRFGPGRPGAMQDETKISQIGGSGTGAASGDATDPAKGTSGVAKMAENKTAGFFKGISKSFQNATGQAGGDAE